MPFYAVGSKNKPQQGRVGTNVHQGIENGEVRSVLLVFGAYQTHIFRPHNAVEILCPKAGFQGVVVRAVKHFFGHACITISKEFCLLGNICCA